MVFIFSCNAEKKKGDPSATIISYKLRGVSLAAGELQRIDDFPSKFIRPRNVDIWLPEDYSSDKKYAVLYMHDGQMLFDSTTTWNKQEWMVDEIASKLMKEGKTRDFIVVAPWNISEIRHSNYFPQKPFESLPEKTRDSLFKEAGKQNHGLQLGSVNSDNYLRFLVEELKPFIDGNFSTLTDKDNTAVMGSSMGGLISMYAISEYPEIFGSAACLSTHWIGTYSNVNNPIPEAFFDYMDKNLPDFNTHKMYFDYGTTTLDAMYLPYQARVNAVLKKKGYKTNLRFEGAAHAENSWQKRIDKPITFILGKMGGK